MVTDGENLGKDLQTFLLCRSHKVLFLLINPPASVRTGDSLHTPIIRSQPADVVVQAYGIRRISPRLISKNKWRMSSNLDYTSPKREKIGASV